MSRVDKLAADIGFELPADYNASRLLYDNLTARAEYPAIICDAGVWTYRELATLASRIGNALLDCGAHPGDRILLFMEDVPAYPAAIMGAMRAGLVPVLLNTLSTPELVQYFLQDSEAPAAIISPSYRDLFSDILLQDCACHSLFVAADGEPGWDRVLQARDDLPEHPTTDQDMALWMYSSGSTGKPKGVVHRHADPAYTAATFGKHIVGIGSEDVCFSVPKIFFAYGFGNSVSFPMSVGACAVLLSGRPNPGSVFEQIKRHRPTLLFGLPTLYTALMHSDSVADADLSSIQQCFSAAEILSAEMAGAWRERFGHDIIEGMGSTEMLHIYLSNNRGERKYGSAGQVVPGYAVKLTGPDGQEVAPGEQGVMSVCGLSAAPEYWRRPDKTAETMRGEWLYTGDRLECDADGFYYFKGRADDLVKVSGQWVYPLEIELALAEHPKVQECCVQALPMADQRMTLHAWVVPGTGAEAGEALVKELQNFVKSTLLPHKYPRRIGFLDCLPKTGTDKLDRQALYKLALGGD